jgi:hypothetical protein
MAMRKSSGGIFLGGPLSERPLIRKSRIFSVVTLSSAALIAAAAFAGCGSSHGGSNFNTGSGSSSGSNGSDNLLGGGGGGVNGAGGDGGNPYTFVDGITAVTCDAGTNAQCVNLACPNGGSTSIVGTVYDPADVNPLYNVTVYIPSVPETQFPNLSTAGVQGVLDGGAAFCSCDGLFPPVVASAVTDAKGNFTITNAPFGQLSIAVQTGKWRMVFNNLNILPCVQNQITDKVLRLPRNATEGNLPDIAISTGNADSLECLPLRIGVDAAEYVAGSGGTGHIHIYKGAGGATAGAATPASNVGLWGSTAEFEAHDVVLLSCEGAETSNMTAANQQSLLDYANAGGRVFLSHYHYAWLRTGPFANFGLATWQGSNGNPETVDDAQGFPGDVDTGFYEGMQMSTWLGNVGGLTPNPVATAATCPDCQTINGALPIFYARDNVVTLSEPATEWIHLDPTVKQAPAATQYFSFDTPVGQAVTAETQPCGRVVYSDLHVSGGANATVPPGAAAAGGGNGACTGTPPACFSADYPNMAGGGGGMFGGGGGATPGTVPNGCRGYGAAANDPSRELSPQEKALEFMLFDLSSCLVPVTMQPTGIIPR